MEKFKIIFSNSLLKVVAWLRGLFDRLRPFLLRIGNRRGANLDDGATTGPGGDGGTDQGAGDLQSASFESGEIPPRGVEGGTLVPQILENIPLPVTSAQELSPTLRELMRALFRDGFKQKIATTGLWSTILEVFQLLKPFLLEKSRYLMREGQSGGLRGTAEGVLVRIAIPLRQLLKNIFTVEYRNVVHRCFVILVVVVTTYYWGKLVALIIAGGPERSSPAPRMMVALTSEEEVIAGFESMKSSNIFRARLASEEEKKAQVIIDDNIVCTEANVPSNLSLKLLNTIVLQDPVKSVAAIQVENETGPRAVRESDKIAGQAAIGRIERLKIIIKNLQTGQCEFVASQDLTSGELKPLDILSEKAGRKLMQKQKKMEGIKNDGDRYYISKKLFNEKMQQIDSILTQAKAIQVPEPDGGLSFKVTEIVPGSIFSYLGIEDNDKVTRINGKKIANMNEVMNIFGTIQGAERLQLTVIKEDGNERTLEYTFSK